MKFTTTTVTLAVALTIASVSDATYQPRCTDYSQDTDLAGDDLKAVYGQTNCQQVCLDTHGCVAFTLFDGTCYLKKGHGTRQWKRGAESALCWHPQPPTDQPNTPNPPPSGQCSTAAFGNCGNNNGITCCPNDQYCQPWSPSFYQCVPLPSKCSKQVTNVDFAGYDLKAVYGLQPEACCEECAKTAGCKAFTFVNSNPGSPACYLKSGEGEHRPMVGAVSGVVN